jgi:hypothetical protein
MEWALRGKIVHKSLPDVLMCCDEGLGVLRSPQRVSWCWPPCVSAASKATHSLASSACQACAQAGQFSARAASRRRVTTIGGAGVLAGCCAGGKVPVPLSQKELTVGTPARPGRRSPGGGRATFASRFAGVANGWHWGHAVSSLRRCGPPRGPVKPSPSPRKRFAAGQPACRIGRTAA